MLLLTESTLFFVNLLITDYESTNRLSVGGTVKDWAALVNEKTSPLPSMSAKTSSTDIDISSTYDSQRSKAATKSTRATTQYSESDAGITTKFGGFDVDCDDDNEEQEAMLLQKGKGSSNKNIALVSARHTQKLSTEPIILGCFLHPGIRL